MFVTDKVKLRGKGAACNNMDPVIDRTVDCDKGFQSLHPQLIKTWSFPGYSEL